MSEAQWLRIRSWHRLRTWTRAPGRALTVCGRQVQDPEMATELPMDEKSCETCLRLAERTQA